MTSQEYQGKIKAMGLTPCRPSYDGATIHQTRDGEFVTVPDPQTLSPDERVDMLELIAMINDLSVDH